MCTPVVVARTEVDRDEPPAVEARGVFGIAAEQFGDRVVARLGLDDPPFGDRPIWLTAPSAGLSDEFLRIGERPRAGLERAGEEGVEAGIGAGGLGGLAHVDIIGVNEALDQALS